MLEVRMEHAMRRRQLTAWWLGDVNEEALGDLVMDWLDAHGATDVMVGCGPDEHPEDWEETSVPRQPARYDIKTVPRAAPYPVRNRSQEDEVRMSDDLPAHPHQDQHPRSGAHRDHHRSERKLMAENQRLREALEQIRDYAPNQEHVDNAHELIHVFAYIARAALHPESTEEARG